MIEMKETIITIIVIMEIDKIILTRLVDNKIIIITKIEIILEEITTITITKIIIVLIIMETIILEKIITEIIMKTMEMLKEMVEIDLIIEYH